MTTSREQAEGQKSAGCSADKDKKITDKSMVREVSVRAT